MILVGESGSTKTSWRLIFPDRVVMLVNTSGVNPVLMSGDEIESVIRPILAELHSVIPDVVYFYGAGCGSDKVRMDMAYALYNVFESESVVVESDLMGACLALCGASPGIVGILGTGSNSCYWGGNDILEQTPSLGFILGDEGSGSAMGKQLMSDFLKRQMPIDLQLKFHDQYDVSPEIAIQRVYKSPFPNRYLAGFTHFISANIDNEYCQTLVENAFDLFIERNLQNYSALHEAPVSFAGSIAYVFQNELKKVCKLYEIEIKTLIKEPIDLLAKNIQSKRYSG
jgi:glucosamine kinase